MDEVTLVIACWCGVGSESFASHCTRSRKVWIEFGGLARMAGLAGLLLGMLPSPSLTQNISRAQLAMHLETPCRTSLAVQWLRLRASTAGGMGPIPGWGIKILRAMRCSQKKKKEKKLLGSTASSLFICFTFYKHLRSWCRKGTPRGASRNV